MTLIDLPRDSDCGERALVQRFVDFQRRWLIKHFVEIVIRKHATRSLDNADHLFGLNSGSCCRLVLLPLGRSVAPELIRHTRVDIDWLLLSLLLDRFGRDYRL